MMSETLANNFHINNKPPSSIFIQQKQQQQQQPTSMYAQFNRNGSNNEQQQVVKRSGSLVFGQKLRESKWFNHSEERIFCAVVETGFIIEHKDEGEMNKCGIAIWTPNFEKSKNPEHLTIYTTVECKSRLKVIGMKLAEFWPNETLIRINNSSDKSQTPLTEDIIRNQIVVVEGTRKKWHNNEHFVYFCRYGPAESANFRIRKITDHLRWNTETFLLKIRSLTAK